MKKKGILRALLIALTACCLAFAFAACATRYTVKYDPGEHAADDATVPETAEYEEGAVIELPAAPAAEAGWQFDEWSDGTATYAAGAEYTVEGDVTFTATWSQVPPAPVEYTVTYALGENAAADATAPAAQTVEEGTAITLPAAPAAAEGYVFDGWYVGDTKLDGTTYTVEGNVTVTAKYVLSQVPPAPVEYTVTYALGENAAADATAPAAQTVDEGTAITLPAAPAAAEVYVFYGCYVGNT